MNMATKKDIFTSRLPEWLKAKCDKAKGGEIARAVALVTGMRLKSVSRSFGRIQLRDPAKAELRGRKRHCTPAAIDALREIWDISGEPCGENLHGVIAEHVRILVRDGAWDHGEEATDKLLAMSLGTVKNMPRVSPGKTLRPTERALLKLAQSIR